uniref:Uncharacterized protein n=1 Tax=Oryza nivara TaxID=4536 RepID=A0A0E0FHN1_ORYNI
MRTTTLYACVATAPAATATAPARVSYHATPCMPTAAAPPLETWSLGGGGSHMWVAEEDHIVNFPTVRLKRGMPIRVTAKEDDD